MAKFDLRLELTPEQEAEANRIEAILLEAAREDIRQMARLMASKTNRELLGETEFQMRDLAHRIGAKALETAANERTKKGVPGC
jgi:hypothetical protein